MILSTKKLDKQTQELEGVFIKELTSQYNTAKESIEKELAKAFNKYAKGDVLTHAEMVKYNRLQNLLNNINGELAKLNRGMTATHTAHAMRVYELNYMGFSELIDNAVNMSVNWGMMNKEAIRESILTPLDKIAISDNADNVRKAVQRQITQSLVKGEGIQKMAQGVTKALETNANNATRIARTETTRVMNASRLDRIKEAEVEGIKVMKRWVSTNDGRTRRRPEDEFDHLKMQGVTVPKDEPFIVNGEKLDYPGDPKGSAANVINCRCSMATELVFEDD